MAEIIGRMRKQPFSRRVLVPAGIALGAWVVLNVLTSHLEWFGSGQRYRTAADILYSLLGFTIIFSSLIIYSVLYGRGALAKEKILWALIVPLAWTFKEIWRVSSIFSLGESFYYALSPLTLGLFVFQLLFLPLCEIFWRWRSKMKDGTIRIFTPGPISVLVIFGILLYFMLFWGNAGDTPGSKLFYIYMEGYKALFVN
jgi:hypothetical protein